MKGRSGCSSDLAQRGYLGSDHGFRLVAPKLVLRALGLFNPALRQTIEMLYEFEEPFIVDHSRFARAFGDHATPLREAIGRTVRWYRDERLTGNREQ